jgi:hypothetical protein
MTRSSFLIAVLTMSLTLTALAYWPTRRAGAADAGHSCIASGAACKIYFRHDAAGPAVQSYTAGVGNNASVSGALVSMDEGWIVLKEEKKEMHIPREAVAMIEVAKR